MFDYISNEDEEELNLKSAFNEALKNMMDDNGLQARIVLHDTNCVY